MRTNIRTLRVLLIEDDEQDAVITRAQLAACSGIVFDTMWVSTLEAGEKALSGGAFDVVLLDLGLPDSEGWESFSRAREAAGSCPVIILSGAPNDTLAVEAVQHGAQDFLVKGHVDSYLLARAIRYAIERAASDAAIRQYQDHLEDLIAARTAELSHTNERLAADIEERKQTEEQLRSALERLRIIGQRKSEFVSNVSHELKTPLASMSYAVDNLTRGVLGALPPRTNEYLFMVKDDCRRLRRTIDDILDMSRIEANSLTLRRTRVPLARLAIRTGEMMKPHAKEKDQTFSVDLQDMTGFVNCDVVKMQRVVTNLIDNAIKFTPSGGTVRLSLHREDADRPMLSLRVCDNGVGIPADCIDRVTERFFRVGEYVTGAGLGLSIAREIVAMHDGRLLVESPPPGAERGTAVTITLPLAETPTVLAVSAIHHMRDLLKKELARHGYTMLACSSEGELMDLIRTCRPDVMVSDLELPDMQGTEAIARLRGNRELRLIPLVAIAGEKQNPTQRELLKGLGIPTLAAPWGDDDLIGCIEEALLTTEAGAATKGGMQTT
jgi:signal transduction histidine kinase